MYFIVIIVIIIFLFLFKRKIFRSYRSRRVFGTHDELEPVLAYLPLYSGVLSTVCVPSRLCHLRSNLLSIFNVCFLFSIFFC